MATRSFLSIALSLAALVFPISACSDDGNANTPNPPDDAATPEAGDAGVCADDLRLAGKCPTLSGYGICTGTGATEEPRAGVFPYEVIAPLFADEAGKHRFIQLPADGQKARYGDRDAWELPVGAIVVKTFFYPVDGRDPAAGKRLIETRLLIRGASEVVPITYIWNAEQTEAVREVAGRDVRVDWIDETGASRTTNYRVPNTNDCKRCHGLDIVRYLGVRTRQTDRPSTAFGNENQIDALAARGFFESTPPSGPRDHLSDPQDESAPIDVRGRSYLDANCGHCHNQSAAADWSGLELDWGEHAPGVLGVCKSPSSAGDTGGHRFDVMPGKPEESVLLYRMQLTNSAYRMPEGSRTPDTRGIGVIAAWIASLPLTDCAVSLP